MAIERGPVGEVGGECEIIEGGWMWDDAESGECDEG